MLMKWIAAGAMSVVLSFAAAAQEKTKIRFTLDWKYQGIHAYVFRAQGQGLFRRRRPRR